MGNDIYVSKLDGSEVKIQSHEELRDFWFGYVGKSEEIVQNRSLNEEYKALVKCIERSFQLRHSGNADFPEVLNPIFGDFTGKVS